MQRLSGKRLIISALLILTTGYQTFSLDGGLGMPPGEREILISRLRQAAFSLRGYAAKNGMDTGLFFLIDMQVPSGRNRFFVYDLSIDSVLMGGLVTHGHGRTQFQLEPKFSNDPGSGCTSLGRYKIGQPYRGKFGLSYKLHGLDSSNNRAFERSVVLHAHESIPDKEIFPGNIAQSEGCPTVSPMFLSQLDQLLKNRKKPVLLYIFN